ncbi:DUF3850 domain-containing protein [Clostridium sporogenes]|uniref:DUF3850 domain-containing protein n=1 Tax=Clostridium sporogenes TaxID=1509 RepID=UPI000B165BAA|nr:DUF3850 domain-containing protein [Clostridium sporogenes]MDS1006420.1 DUF3850 domain-containing protein [Clostridium sporogenes]
MKHRLKTLSKYFNAVCDGKKTFEIRKDDRNFEIGDTFILNLRLLQKVLKIFMKT